MHKFNTQETAPLAEASRILLYLAGLRLLDCLRRRVKDLDFVPSEITVQVEGTK